MLKINFIRVITFISILVLFFAQSLYDPSVHAKMQKMEDESLSEVDAAAINLELNMTVRSVIDNGLSLKASDSSSEIKFTAMELCNGTPGTPVNLNAIMSWDIGSTDSRTWLLGTNIILPVNNTTGLALFANNPVFVTHGGTTLPMGNSMAMDNVAIGGYANVSRTNLNPGYLSSFTAPWVIISSAGSNAMGLQFYGEVAAYIGALRYRWNNNMDSVTASGIYVYGMMNQIAPDGDASTWTAQGDRTGAAKLGGSYPYYNVTSGAVVSNTTTIYYNSIDIGSTSTQTRIFMNLPIMGSIRVRDFSIGGTSFGPFALDDIVFYKNQITFHDL